MYTLKQNGILLTVKMQQTLSLCSRHSLHTCTSNTSREATDLYYWLVLLFNFAEKFLHRLLYEKVWT